MRFAVNYTQRHGKLVESQENIGLLAEVPHKGSPTSREGAVEYQADI